MLADSEGLDQTAELGCVYTFANYIASIWRDSVKPRLRVSVFILTDDIIIYWTSQKVSFTPKFDLKYTGDCLDKGTLIINYVKHFLSFIAVILNKCLSVVLV